MTNTTFPEDFGFSSHGPVKGSTGGGLLNLMPRSVLFDSHHRDDALAPSGWKLQFFVNQSTKEGLSHWVPDLDDLQVRVMLGCADVDGVLAAWVVVVGDLNSVSDLDCLGLGL